MAGIYTGTTVPVANTLPLSFVSTHPTTNLPGYPAYDWMRPAGTLIGSPTSGTVQRTSGSAGSRGGTVYGYSLYLAADSGEDIFLTHFGALNVQAGQRVQRGSPLGRVAPYGTASHIHYAVRSSQPVGSTITLGKPRPGKKGDRDGRFPIFPIDLPSLPDLPDLPVLGAVEDVWTAATAVPRAVKWTFENWDRVLEVAGGFILLLVGLYLLGRQLGVVSRGLPSLPGRSGQEDAAALERMAGIEQRQFETTVARAAGRERAEREIEAKAAMTPEKKAGKARRKAAEKEFQTAEIPF